MDFWLRKGNFISIYENTQHQHLGRKLRRCVCEGLIEGFVPCPHDIDCFSKNTCLMKRQLLTVRGSDKVAKTLCPTRRTFGFYREYILQPTFVINKVEEL
jgi:hypothetical protein